MQQSQRLSRLTKPELQQALEFAEGVVATVHTSLLVLDASLRVVWANDSFYELFSLTRQETERRSIYEIGNCRWDTPELRRRLRGILSRNAGFSDLEVDLDLPGVGRRTMVLNARRLHDGDPDPVRVLLAIEDITERRRREEAKAASELRYRRLFETAPDGMLIISAETGKITDVNRYLLNMMGYSRSQLLGRRLWEVGAFKDASRSREACEKLQKSDYARYEDLPLETRTGEVLEVEVVSNAYLVNNERVIQCNIRDISERKRLERDLTFSATHDSLTGLPNRTLFIDHYALALAGAKRHHKKLAMMVLDIDHFKDINDTLGHHSGDLLLKKFGRRLTSVVRKADTVSRLGGDEFGLLVTEAAGSDDIAKVAQKLLENARRPFMLANHEVRISASIGSSDYPDDGEEGETLLRLADTAMYQAKKNGRDNYVRYELGMSP